MDKNQSEENLKKPSEGGTNTIKGPKEAETPVREETRQPHELPSADPLVTDRQNSPNDLKAKIEEEIESNQRVHLRTDNMDTSEPVRYLMSPLNIPGETMEDGVEIDSNQRVYLITDDMDTSELVRYLMSPLNIPGETMEDGVDIESNQRDYLRIDVMDTSELVRYLMSPLNIPGETMEDEVETFNYESVLDHKIYLDDDIDVINNIDDESFDEG